MASTQTIVLYFDSSIKSLDVYRFAFFAGRTTPSLLLACAFFKSNSIPHSHPTMSDFDIVFHSDVSDFHVVFDSDVVSGCVNGGNLVPNVHHAIDQFVGSVLLSDGGAFLVGLSLLITAPY